MLSTIELANLYQKNTGYHFMPGIRFVPSLMGHTCKCLIFKYCRSTKAEKSKEENAVKPLFLLIFLAFATGAIYFAPCRRRRLYSLLSSHFFAHLSGLPKTPARALTFASLAIRISAIGTTSPYSHPMARRCSTVREPAGALPPLALTSAPLS